MSSLTLIGIIEIQPVVTETPSTCYAEFTILTLEKYWDAEQKEQTRWITNNVVATSDTARELSKTATKGREIAVTGRLTYMAEKDQQGKYKPVVVIEDYALLSGGENQ